MSKLSKEDLIAMKAHARESSWLCKEFQENNFSCTDKQTVIRQVLQDYKREKRKIS